MKPAWNTSFILGFTFWILSGQSYAETQLPEILTITQNNDQSLSIALMGTLRCNQAPAWRRTTVNANIIDIQLVIGSFPSPCPVNIPPYIEQEEFWQYYSVITTEPLETGNYTIELHIGFTGDAISINPPYPLHDSQAFTVFENRHAKPASVPTMTAPGWAILLVSLVAVAFRNRQQLSSNNV